MDLKKTLLQDLKAALKERDSIKKDTVQIIRAAVLQVEKDKQIELDDEAIAEVISKELKKRLDVLPDYERSGRQDLIDEINQQIKIYKSYLPQQLTEEEILAIVKKAVSETGASSIKDMGKVMAVVSPLVKGRADGKLVGSVVKKAISS
ncbi:MAG: GatB/YqeY domain-containing protein [Clostridiales bacterium]|jgi:uncharacterized protein YqeY|nr:GatB/YqeY domain-containing protein [Clostridiales bacterium]